MRRGRPHPLDQPARIARLDPSGMGARIEGFGRQLAAGASIVGGVREAIPARMPRRFVVMGMGGSAIAAELLRSVAEREGAVPIQVARHYDPPCGLGAEDFLVLSSYSGETEETLEAYDATRAIGAAMCVVSTGGTLAARARRDGWPVAVLPPGHPPRAALGYSFAVLTLIAGHLGILGDAPGRVDAAARDLDALASACGRDVVVSRNRAKRLAIRLRGRAVLLLGNERTLYPAALRWKGQLNENSKHLAWASPLPEMTHNEIDGFAHPAALVRRTAAVFLRDPEDHDRVASRFEWLGRYLKRRSILTETVSVAGADPMSRLLQTVLLGDFVSYYLAILNGSDPSALPGVEALKRVLRA